MHHVQPSPSDRLTRFLLTALTFAAAPLAFAQTVATWTGAGSDLLWNNPLNWDTGVPGATNGNTVFGAGTHIVIPEGVVATPGMMTSGAMIFGPEWGGTLDIYGSLNYNWHMAPIGAADNPSEINLYAGASLAGEGIALGQNWWFNDAPYVNLTMHENSSVLINYLFWGGQINLLGGTFSTGGINTDSVGMVSDATRQMNITEGTFILRGGDFSPQVMDWINRGILLAYGGDGQIVIDTTSVPGETRLTAVHTVVPEPAHGAALAGLGVLAILALRRRA